MGSRLLNSLGAATLGIVISVILINSVSSEVPTKLENSVVDSKNFTKEEVKVDEMLQKADSLIETAHDSKKYVYDMGKKLYVSKVNVSVSRGGTKANLRNYNLNESFGFSGEDLDIALKGTKLEGIGRYAKEAEDTYGVNAVFIISLAQHESGFGKSRIAEDKNNLFGIGAYDRDPYACAFSYETKRECIMDFAKLIRKRYFENKELYDLMEIGSIYSSDDKWAAMVAQMMNENITKILKHRMFEETI